MVMEVNQLTGYGSVDLGDVKEQVGTALKRVEDTDDKMILYFDEVSTVCFDCCPFDKVNIYITFITKLQMRACFCK